MAGWYIVWQIVVWLVTTAISSAMIKVPKGGPAAGADKFKFPTASEDRSIPVIFGPRWAKGPNVVWWGNLISVAIKQSAGRKYAFFGPKRYTIINYIYKLGMHLILSHRADKIMAIKMGEKVLAEGLSITANATVAVDKPELFGGEKSGGGFVGPIDVEFGLDAQPVNSYLDGLISGPVSAHRGVVGLVMKDCAVTAAPPGQGAQILPVSVLMSATASMCSWYPAKVTCPGGGMNPAHMLRVASTRQAWNNQQYTDGDVDDANFTVAADLLFDEDFGLAAEISDEAISADDAIGEILRHIDGTLFEDKVTGKLSLALNRGGYVVADLPLLDDSVVLEVEEYTRLGWGERVNQIAVSYYDLEADKDRSTTPLYDAAAAAAQGGVVSRVQRYPWIFQGELAARLCERDLRQMTADLGVATLVCNRVASSLRPGRLFRWSCQKLGVVEIVMRIKRMDYGSLADGRVRIICVQDIFSLPTAVYSAPPPSGWVDPVNDPSVATVRAVIEAPFWLTGPGAFNPTTDGALLALAGKPTPDATDFEFWAGTPYEEVMDTPGSFSETTTLSAAVDTADTTTFPVAPGITSASVGKLALVNAEIVRIDAVGALLTVSRGMLDTVPAPSHGSGSLLLVFEDNLSLEPFANGAGVNVKLLPATIRGRLDITMAPADVVIMNQRHLRPYPPANLKINGASYPASIVGSSTASWAHRDRLQQLAEPLVVQGAASIGPEPGTTYTVRWYSPANTLQSTQSGITGESSAPFSPPADGVVRVTVEAIRGGVGSWQLAEHTYDVTAPAGPVVAALLHFNGTDASTIFTDETGKTWTASGNAQIDTAQSQFGGASGLFDGNNDYVTTPTHADFNFADGDFTVELWARANTLAGTDNKALITRDQIGGTRGWLFFTESSGDKLTFAAWTGGVSNGIADTVAFATGTWVHVAACRQGGTLRLYKGGVQVASGAITGSVGSPAEPCVIGTLWAIGAPAAAAQSWPG